MFSNKSDLVNLNNLDLGNNQLKSLDSWPFVRAQAHPGVTVRLSENKINSFTNAGNFSFRCGMPPLNMHFYLDWNPIRHVFDILGMTDINKNGTNKIHVACMLQNKAHPDLDMSIDGVPLTCDCHDYEFVRIVRYMRHNVFVNSAYCVEPKNLYGKSLDLYPSIN